nr:hypothetical protein [Tanacetum cinerariifolium]
MGLLGIASVASLVSDVSVKKASRKVSTTGMRKVNFGTGNEQCKIGLGNTSQVSSIHALAPILSTKEPEHLLSMGYEHLSITPEIESDEVTKSNAENLLPIPSKCEVTSEDKKKCDVPISENSPICDNSDIFSDSKIDDDILNYNDDFKDIEYVEASFPNPEIERLINLVKSDIPDNSSNDPLLEEVDLFLSDNSIPPGIENVNDDSDEEVDAVDDLHVDNFIQNSKHEYSESEDSDFDNPPLPLPPLEPPDEEFDFEIDFRNEISVVRNTIVKFEYIDARTVFSDKNDVLSYFMFDKVFSILSAESEDTIFDPGISD